MTLPVSFCVFFMIIVSHPFVSAASNSNVNGVVNTSALSDGSPPYYTTTVSGTGSFTVSFLPQPIPVNYPDIPIVAPAEQCINKSVSSGGDSEKFCCTCGPNKSPQISMYSGRGCQGSATSTKAPKAGTYSCGGVSRYTNIEIRGDLSTATGCGQPAGTAPTALGVCVNDSMLVALNASAAIRSAAFPTGVQSYRYKSTCVGGNVTVVLERWSGTKCDGTIGTGNNKPQSVRVGSASCMTFITVTQTVQTFPVMVKIFTRAKDVIYDGQDVTNKRCVATSTSDSTQSPRNPNATAATDGATNKLRSRLGGMGVVLVMLLALQETL